MDLEFPRSCWRSPGQIGCGNYRSFEERVVASKAEWDEALRSGWYTSVDLALAAEDALQTGERDEPELIDDDEPVTRAEMEAMASQLGIKFDGRTTDKALMRKIEAATGG